MNTRPSSSFSGEEISQAKARLGLCLFGVLYLTGLFIFSKPESMLAPWVFLGFCLFSSAWFLYVRWDLSAPAWRRILALLADLGITTFFMFTLGESGSFLYPIYLWTIVGFGVRFGPRFLIAATVMGSFLFGNVLLFSAYWQTNLIGGIGLWAGLIILPLFYLSLIRRLKATNRQLNQALDDSQAATRAKSAFLANMSHELRTPMHGVIGTAELMQMTTLDQQQKEYMALIQSSARSLLTIINDILDFSQIEAGKLKLFLEPIEIRDIIKNVYQIFQPQAASKGLQFQWDVAAEVPSFLLGDHIRVRQILFNLVGNAVKYTLKGFVKLRVICLKREDSLVHLAIEVEDSGIGIPKASLQDVFGEFERVGKHRDYRFSGTGLGLPISLNLATLMGGNIEAHSEVGEGSTFTVKLQLEEAKDVQGQVANTGPEVLETYALKALVVEDNHVNQLITKAFLTKLGILSQVAQNGFEVQKLFQNQDFDLIFMDYQLPGMNGIAVTRWIRDQENDGHHIPIIALTANVSHQDRRACLEAGMDDYLSKPLTFEALQAVMRNLDQAKLIPKKDALG